MKKEFLKKCECAEFLTERVKQRNKEIEKIAYALDNALCVIDDKDFDELLLNIARVIYFYGCRFKGNEEKN